jgi:ribonucleoside-diphosphate reductase alpha chain
MWANRRVYNGLSVLPFTDHSYVQAPFEDCDKETYEKMLSLLKNVNLDLVIETTDETDLSGEIACGGGGSCEIF